MQGKFNFLIVILLLINFGFSFYLLSSKDSSNRSPNSQIQNTQMTQQVPKVVQDIRAKNEQLKKEKPHLFMGPEELSKYDCNSITDPKEKKQCTDIQENYKVSQLFKGLSQSQIASFDCTKIQDTTLITRCNDYIKITKEMQTKTKAPTK